MNTPLPPADPLHATQSLAALRAVFQDADRDMRKKLSPILPPAEVEFAGIRMYVDPRDNYTDMRIWLDGQPPELKSLMSLMEIVEGRRALVLDIGANCGAYAVPLGLAVGPGSRVVAFEPNPVMIGRLGHNIALNDLGGVIRVEGCALGRTSGEAVLNFRGRNFGQASLKPIPGKLRTGGTVVPVRPLLDFTAEAAAYEITVLKIDVEGAEDAVLGPLLDQGGWLPKAVLLETRHAQEWDRDVVALMQARGFRPTLEAEGNTLFTREGQPT